MIIIPTSKPQNYYDYTGTPDEVITPSNEDLVKDWEVHFSIFRGWVKKPIYKDISDVDTTKCNKSGTIYRYAPQHSLADKFGMLKYKLVGATKKKSDKRILLIVEDTHKKAIFKHIYLEIKDGKVIDCGHVYNTTLENWNNCPVGSEYTGHRKSKWIKLDPDDYSSLTGKTYSE
jgi:hypothetical protein